MYPDIDRIQDPLPEVFDATSEPNVDDVALWLRMEPVLDDFEQLQDFYRETSTDANGVTTMALGVGGISRTGHEAVRTALTQRGVVESGGEDGGIPFQRYVRWFLPNQSARLPWCAFFVSWCIDTSAAGNRNRRVPWPNPGYVGSIYQWAKSNSRLVTIPVHGDLFGFGDNHIGLVAGANNKTGTIWTIEGNYSDRVTQRSINYRATRLWFARLFNDR